MSSALQPAGVSGYDQVRFARVVTEKLRESRRRQKLTQADVAKRTSGLVSKAALANYETGHRSLRIDVLWVIARALGEDLGDLLASVENEVAGSRPEESPSSIGIKVSYLNTSHDPRLEPVRRWWELRHSAATPETADDSVVNLDADALRALADLMQVSVADARGILTDQAS